MDAIVAVYSDWGISENGVQPVYIKADRTRFRELTAGSTLIYGSHMLSQFPDGKPLEGRKSIVLNRRCDPVSGATVVGSVAEVLDLAKNEDHCFVIGGANVFMELFRYTQKVYITKVNLLPVSDSFFPNLDANPEWVCSEQSEEYEENGISYVFCTYERRQ